MKKRDELNDRAAGTPLTDDELDRVSGGTDPGGSGDGAAKPGGNGLAGTICSVCFGPLTNGVCTNQKCPCGRISVTDIV